MRFARPMLRLTPLVLALGAGACDDQRSPKNTAGTPSPSTAPSTGDEATAPQSHAIALAGDPLHTTRSDDGLVIDVFAEGAGDPLTPGQTGLIDFEMRLADATILDSSQRRRAALRVPLTEGSAVPGLLRGLEGMRVGESRRLHIPSALAYGDVGRPPIPPRADLVIDVTLLEIVEAE